MCDMMCLRKSDIRFNRFIFTCLLTICLVGCESTGFIDAVGKEHQSADGLAMFQVNVSIGSYQIQGWLGPVREDKNQNSDVLQAWRFIHPDTEFVINRHGLVFLTKLDGKDIQLHLNRIQQEDAHYLQVQLGQPSAEALNYIVLTCTDWQQKWDMNSQACQANGNEPAHQIQVQLDKQQPVAIRQWLPYLHMLFTLQRI